MMTEKEIITQIRNDLLAIIQRCQKHDKTKYHKACMKVYNKATNGGQNPLGWHTFRMKHAYVNGTFVNLSKD